VYSRVCVVAIFALAALALPASASATFTEITPFSGTFGCPGQLAFDAGGGGREAAVYVEDNCAPSSPALSAYTADGSTLVSTFNGGEPLQYFSYGGTTECFDSLAGAAVDPATGDVYVADEGANSLFDFNDAGTDQAQVTSGPCTVSAGPLSGPLVVAGLEGPPLSGSSFTTPQGLSVYDGNLYVAGDDLVQYTALGLAGADVEAFSHVTNDPDPVDVAIDPNTGATFVADDEDDLVDQYDAAGNFVRLFATGFGGGAFRDPAAVAVDPVAHVVYVADGGVVDTFNESTGASLLQVPARTGETTSGIALDTTNHVLYVSYSGSTNYVDQFSYTPAPSCNTESGATKGGVATSIALSCADRSAAAVTYAVASAPAHGTISALNPSTGALTYTPDPGFAGTDTFTYTGSSVDGTSNPTTVSVTVTGPTCSPETLTTAYQAAVQVTLACSDSASPVSSYEVVGAPTHGSLSAPSADGLLTYTPDGIFEGTDSFVYEGVSANGQTSAPETVTIYVGEPLPPPVEGQTANVYFASGTVTILLPGQTTPIPLLAGFQAPLGSTIQTTNGEAGVFVAIDGVIQGANFFNGKFTLTQSPDPHTILTLLGRKIPKVRCAIHPRSFTGAFNVAFAHAVREAPTATLAKKHHKFAKPTRQLWGSGHGDFTTVGNGSSASVRGTQWAVFDYPDGTLTFDFTDSVSVFNFHLHKTVVITAGHYYFAALGNLPPCKRK
jgi:DNA-binding beta-propeller fold protein YncE